MFSPTYIKDLNQQYTGACVGLNTIKERTDEIIRFFRQFDRYTHLTYEELYQMISPSVRSQQYKTFRNGTQIWGFVNWAFVNQAVLDQFQTKGQLGTLDWQSGLKQVYVEFVSDGGADHMMSWMKNYSLNLMGPNVRCYWIRSEDGKIKIRKIRTKESWRWDQQ